MANGIVKGAKGIGGTFIESGDDKIEGIVTKPGKYVDKFAGSKQGKNIGAWAFMIGFLVALIVGVVSGLNATGAINLDMGINSMMTGILVAIGIIIGLVNVSVKESMKFMTASIVIIVAPVGFGAMNVIDVMGVVNGLSAFLAALTGSMAIFVAPAAIIVALKAIYSTARGA